MKKLCLFLLVVLCSCGVRKSIKHLPQTEGYSNEMPIVTKHSPTSFSYKDNFLFKNPENNLWEMYVEGDALQRGLVIGSLSDSLLKKQEKIFFGKIKQLVPSEFKLRLLRQFLKVYNRKLYKNVSEEYQTEIYGLSRFVSKDFDEIAPPYLRTLYLHGAHDIGSYEDRCGPRAGKTGAHRLSTRPSSPSRTCATASRASATCATSRSTCTPP